MIWNNAYLKVDHKIQYHHEWIRHSINYVQNLYHDEGDIMDKTDFEHKYNITIQFMQYDGLIILYHKRGKGY